MKKVRCLLVDDEPLALALLEHHIAQMDMLEVIGKCGTAIKALEILNTRPVDLLFLDIRMPAITGIELLKTLRQPPKVVITTAYREYALDGYDLDVIDYLLKPITLERFFKAVTRVIRAINPGSQVDPPAHPQQPEAIPSIESPALYIKSGYRNVKVSVDSILYMESLKDYIKIHLKNGSLLTKYKIGEMEAQLPAGQFLRIHRSFIINLKHLSAFTASQVEIGQLELPIGESYKELVLMTLWKERAGDKA